jgi:hypothetical protein
VPPFVTERRSCAVVGEQAWHGKSSRGQRISG